jgi:hypothetical protein
MEVPMLRRKIVLLLLLCVAGMGCEEENSDPITTTPDISGNLVKVDGCKSGLTKSGADRNSSCLKFTNDATAKTLTLLHVNAGFNCCPKEIKAEVSVENDTIRITESESGGNCRCNCLYDLHILVENVPAQSFGIVVEEPFVSEQETRIEFSVDFSKVTEGEHCVPRNFYPWGT